METLDPLPTPIADGSARGRWDYSRRQWVWVALIILGVVLVFLSYEMLNTAPGSSRWPGYWATDPETGRLAQPDSGPDAYQTFVLKSWLDAKVPFVPWLAVPYLSFLVIVPFVVPGLNLAARSFRRFVTVGLALIVSQLFLDLAYVLFQTEVIRDVEKGDGVSGWLVGMVWGNDHPFNGYPSGHCTWTTIGILSLWRLRRVFPRTAWVLMAWLSLVYPATVMLRQHYLMDVYAGIFVGFACYWAVMFAVERPRLVPAGEPDLGAPESRTN